MIAEFSPG